jgi:hypothetical protein
VNLKILASAAIAGAFVSTALGIGAGTANAAPISPAAPETMWPQDPGWGHGHGHGHDGGDWGHGGGGWYGPGYGPGWYGPGINACVSATGPWGYVSGSVCI